MKYWVYSSNMNTAQIREALVISIAVLSNPLKISLAGLYTDYSYTLLETLHWLFSKSSHNFLSLLQGPVMKFRFQPKFHFSFCHQDHLPVCELGHLQ